MTQETENVEAAEEAPRRKRRTSQEIAADYQRRADRSKYRPQIEMHRDIRRLLADLFEIQATHSAPSQRVSDGLKAIHQSIRGTLLSLENELPKGLVEPEMSN